uniref:Protein quiver n=1 Tax=Timema tahoe TaxID=61484 RepID=A0A7R9IGZ5_9NEOP|nr:unnamed protein product [Timema tahoe]
MPTETLIQNAPIHLTTQQYLLQTANKNQIFIIIRMSVLQCVVKFVKKSNHEEGDTKMFPCSSLTMKKVPQRDVSMLHLLINSHKRYGLKQEQQVNLTLFLFIPVHDIYLLGLGQDELTQDTLKKAEEFVCRLYLLPSPLVNINEVRIHDFKKGTKVLEALPPTADVLHHHILRAHCHALVWLTSDPVQQQLSSVITSGRELKPVLSTKVNGQWRYFRSCAYLGEPGIEGDERFCLMRTGTYNIFMEYCTCNSKDGCNSALAGTVPANIWYLVSACLLVWRIPFVVRVLW